MNSTPQSTCFQAYGQSKTCRLHIACCCIDCGRGRRSDSGKGWKCVGGGDISFMRPRQESFSCTKQLSCSHEKETECCEEATSHDITVFVK